MVMVMPQMIAGIVTRGQYLLGITRMSLSDSKINLVTFYFYLLYFIYYNSVGKLKFLLYRWYSLQT